MQLCYASIAAKICRVPIRLYCQWGIRYVGLSGMSRKLFKLIEKLVCQNSTDIRAVSPLNKAFAVSEGLYSVNKAIVVGNGGTIGVDMAKYDINQKITWRNEIREQYGINPDSFVFGFSGRISVDKGCRELPYLLLRKLRKKEVNSKLFIVGPVEDNCGIDPTLIAWARNSKNIVMTGMIEGSEMCKYYAAMDTLVHPTYREGFGDGYSRSRCTWNTSYYNRRTRSLRSYGEWNFSHSCRSEKYTGTGQSYVGFE